MLYRSVGIQVSSLPSRHAAISLYEIKVGVARRIRLRCAKDAAKEAGSLEDTLLPLLLLLLLLHVVRK